MRAVGSMDDLDEESGASQRRRFGGAGLVVGAWVLVVAVAASIGWFVVDRAGASLLEASGISLGAPSTTPATGTATASLADSHSTSMTTAGGRVAAICTTSGIALQIATPAQGWRMATEASGSGKLEVTFTKAAKEVGVEGRCVGGVAVLSLSHGKGGSGGTSATTHSGSGGSSGSGSTATKPPIGGFPSGDDHGGAPGGGDHDGGGISGGTGGGGGGTGGGGHDGGGTGGSGGDDHSGGGHDG